MIDQPTHNPHTETADIPVIGMTCANCSAAVERTLIKRVPGVTSASVNLAAESVNVAYDPDVTSLNIMAAAVQKAGYRLVISASDDDRQDDEQQARQQEIDRERLSFLVGVVFTIPLFIISMSRDFGLLGSWAHAPWVNWLFFCLAAPVQFYTGRGFYSGGFKSLRNGIANMDVLVALGSTTAFVYSVAVLTLPGLGGHVYFETSAVIITLIKLGKLLESRAKGKASTAIKNLMNLAPAFSSVTVVLNSLRLGKRAI